MRTRRQCGSVGRGIRRNLLSPSGTLVNPHATEAHDAPHCRLHPPIPVLNVRTLACAMVCTCSDTCRYTRHGRGPSGQQPRTHRHVAVLLSALPPTAAPPAPNGIGSWSTTMSGRPPAAAPTWWVWACHRRRSSAGRRRRRSLGITGQSGGCVSCRTPTEAACTVPPTEDI